MDYSDFVLRISPSPEAGRFVVSAASATAGEASGTFTTPFSDTELENFILRIGLTRRGVRRINSPEWRSAQVFGEKLFRQLFTEDIRSTFLASRNDALREGKGLRVKFIVDAPALANYPWEFLYDPSLGRFLSLYEATPIVRYVELSSPPQVLRVAPPLRVLVLASSPSDYPPLDLAREKNNLDSALAELVQQNQIAVDWLPNASLEALRLQLLKRAYHIFHFIGHGGFDESAPDGVLVFEDESKRSRPISGERLAVLLGNHRTLQLAILNACEGARTSTQDPFAGAALTLVKSGGVSAVVAMQFEITDEASIAFSRGFYGALAVGSPVDAAVAQARPSIFAEDNDVEWGTPVLYLRAPDGVIFVPLSPEEIARTRAEETKREREKQAEEQIAREKAEAERLAKEKAEAERLARDRVEQEQIARERAEQERLAKEKAEAERLAHEKAERERVAQVAKLYTAAQQQFARKNYTDASNTLASLLALDPANPTALELKTRIESMRAEQERDAKNQAERARAVQIANLLSSAQSNYARRKYSAAIEAAEKILVLNPNHVAAQELERDAQAKLDVRASSLEKSPATTLSESSTEKHGFLNRLWGVIIFKVPVYREIAYDTTATKQAISILLVVTLVNAVFGELFRASGLLSEPTAIRNASQYLLEWMIGPLLFSFTAKGFGGKTNAGEMFRVFGFVQVFYLFSIIPLLGGLVASVLVIIGVVIGIRETSNFTKVRASVTVIVGFVILLILLFMIGSVFVAFGI